MFTKSHSRILFSFVTVCVFLLGLGATLRRAKPTREFKIQSIKIASGTSQEAKRGYDTKVVVTLISTGMEPPALKNRIYAGSGIICPDACFIQSFKEAPAKVLPQKPQFDVSAGSPLVVSFLYNKAKLPPGKIALHGTIKAQYVYNIQEPNRSGSEVHESPGVLVKADVQ